MRRKKPTYDLYIQVMMIGDSTVGKSSLLTQFADETFATVKSTIGECMG